VSIVNKKEDDAIGSKSGEERREESDKARRLGSGEARKLEAQRSKLKARREEAQG